MQVTKEFQDKVLSALGKNDVLAEAIQWIGFEGVKRAYNGNLDPLKFAMDNLTDNLRKPLFRWLKRAGINIQSPVPGSKSYTILGIVDSKRQEKAFEFCKANPVIEQEQKITPVKKAKVLTGTAIARATEAVSRTIKNLRKDDPVAAHALNELVQRPKMALILEDGQIINLSADELRETLGVISALRIESEESVIANAKQEQRAVKEDVIQREIDGLETMLAEGLITQADYDRQMAIVTEKLAVEV